MCLKIRPVRQQLSFQGSNSQKILLLVSFKNVTTSQKQVKPKNSSIADHLLFCNHSASYGNFGILMRENKKVFL